jgi:ARC6-like, IMS domain/DnaJ domain
VRIPLDYYRILGLPIQATAEQLKQAHRDRTLQLPRREYSETAIAARKHLIDQAATILANPSQRELYDDTFLPKSYELEASALAESTMGADQSLHDPQSPSIDIPEHQFVGALLVLQELGEYELVLKLGRPYLTSGNSSLKDGRFGDPRIILADIVLTVALACLELGREQWQQGQYENAAEALETGQELLLREGVFVAVRGEIQADLLRLRPYRILELLALPIGNADERQRGIQLLRTMLQERGGIDGTGNDQSGLTIDDFLRFIQQLRGYLTAEEQQSLFEEEARRPSAVATYLAVYALLALGFTKQQPVLVRRAKSMLLRLGSRQDVHLEQAVCSLLLGQTEEASRALELSQEYEPLAFIREHSQGAPDLLPGLCLYAERWLQDEVFPHFRDLAQKKALLKDYFADQQVQSYLEALPADAEEDNAELRSVTPAAHGWGQSRDRQEATAPHHYAPAAQRSAPSDLADSNGLAYAERDPATPSHRPKMIPMPVATLAAAGAGALAAATPNVVTMPGDRLPVLEGADNPPADGGKARPRGNRPPDGARLASGAAQRRPPSPAAIGPRHNSSSRLFFLLGAGLVLVALLGFLMTRLLKALGPGDSTEPLMVQLDQPVLPQFAEPTNDDPNVVNGDMTPPAAQKLLELWLKAKGEAMGQTHDTSRLAQTLAEPKLSAWQGYVQEAKRDNWHKQYEHTLKIDAVEVNATDPNQATVNATVTEISKYFQAGQLSDSKADDLKLRYSLIREAGQWRVRDWQVL